MPRMRVMRYGCTLSFAHGLAAPDMTDSQKHNRQRNRGWTPATSRNLANFLMSLNLDRVDGTPYAMTLTIPAACEEPVDPDLLHAMLAMWIRRQQRLRGLVHYYWLLEFTRQGTPHIHLTVWCREERTMYDRHARAYRTISLPPMDTQAIMLADWVSICNDNGLPARMTGQDFRPVDATPQGWLSYTAKHSVRGVAHYQRRYSSMPEKWRDRPGAMWGHDRDLSKARNGTIDVPMSREAFWALRRIIRRHLVNQAKRITNPSKRGKAIAASRRMLKRGLTLDERQAKQQADANGWEWRPKSAFMGLRAWLSPEEQHDILTELLTGPHADYYRPLVGRPVRHPANPGKTRDNNRRGDDTHTDAAPSDD